MAKIIVRVPASSANLGPGMDSLGLAFKLYYTVIVEEKTTEWKVNHALGDDVPTDENNLIVQSILKTNPDIHPHQLTVISDVPIAHGLGSSTTAVVAGIKIANSLGDLNLSTDEQIRIGSEIEGHPENVAAAILGNLIVSTYDGKDAVASAIDAGELSALMYIRPDGISEVESRAKLPKTLNYQDAVLSSSRANMFVTLMSQGKIHDALPLVEGDKMHEPFRKAIVPELDVIREKAHSMDIYGTYLSGAGPTVGTLGKKSDLVQLRLELQQMDLNGSLRILDVDTEGATVRGE
ncbi:homoserine kinase [Lentilactobacillus curieae]|uniref:Homoserine kinase n=1 Tax=Lentilactobacillus curieae TaxID=1138822 RepID=A0A1S6QJF2_9LACO|nr:homoserine kinase [Lentilactobacillus curieae]AQW21757.1 homoserine kinase [Lentilactobacillus curieae]